ncbi:hypothetical protein AYO38_01620 [bacterium SCGC AG-212-C10]|nr:hypothetical protein AYO38_01620 [bacterium SCGC AG-212-C10]
MASSRTDQDVGNDKVNVAIESGKKRTFASALDWPGWTRSGRDEAAALESLLAYGPRYQHAIRSRRLGFKAPQAVASFTIVERLAGDATTEFGAPAAPASVESLPVNDEELKRLTRVLERCWIEFEAVVAAAEGKSLRKGPRGGGRTVERIVDHVVDAHYSYLRNIYWRKRRESPTGVSAVVEAVKSADAEALAFAVSDGMPERGPRGGELWKPRYFVRRSAWHILDHAWEIEDRVED